MTRLRLASIAATMAFLTVPAIVPASAQDKTDKAAGGDKSELYQQLNLFGDVLERIRRDYVEPADEKSLIENAINGMLASLDPHSSYMNPKNYKTCRFRHAASSAAPRHRSDDGTGRDQGRVADRRHAGRQGGLQSAT